VPFLRSKESWGEAVADTVGEGRADRKEDEICERGEEFVGDTAELS
jgi:hypothetical protein